MRYSTRHTYVFVDVWKHFKISFWSTNDTMTRTLMHAGWSCGFRTAEENTKCKCKYSITHREGKYMYHMENSRLPRNEAYKSAFSYKLGMRLEYREYFQFCWLVWKHFENQFLQKMALLLSCTTVCYEDVWLLIPVVLFMRSNLWYSFTSLPIWSPWQKRYLNGVFVVYIEEKYHLFYVPPV